MLNIFQGIERLVLKDHDSFVSWILSHGSQGNVVYASDGEPVELNKLTLNCENLRGKPKMVFIKACRGSGQDEGAIWPRL